MLAERHAAVRLLDLAGRGVAAYAEDLVVVLLRRLLLGSLRTLQARPRLIVGVVCLVHLLEEPDCLEDGRRRDRRRSRRGGGGEGGRRDVCCGKVMVGGISGCHARSGSVCHSSSSAYPRVRPLLHATDKLRHAFPAQPPPPHKPADHTTTGTQRPTITLPPQQRHPNTNGKTKTNQHHHNTPHTQR